MTEIPDTDELTFTPPSKDQEEKLRSFAEFLLEENRKFNLTGAKDFETVWNRHILDSLVLTTLLPEKGTILDLGSGGGFPALPLAIMRTDIRYTLVESTGKKARFLQAAIEHLGLQNVTVAAVRSEDLARRPEHREQFDAVTVRAVAALPALIELCVPFLKVDGCLLAMKGRSVEAEIQAADHALDELDASMTNLYPYLDSQEEDACILEITKMAPTSNEYPRASGQPANFPL